MTSRTRRITVLGLLPFLALAASCDGDGLPEFRPGTSSDVTDAPQPTDAPETAPPETAPPETAPPETAPPETAPPATDAPSEPEEDDDGSNSGLLIALVLLGIGVLVAVIALATRRRPAPTDDPRPRILSTTRWIHDQLSLEILALPPADAQVRWNAERSRFDQLVIDVRSIAPSQQTPSTWEQLAGAVAALASSLDTAVRVRASQDVDPDLARESVSIANGHRSDLQRALLAAEQAR